MAGPAQGDAGHHFVAAQSRTLLRLWHALWRRGPGRRSHSVPWQQNHTSLCHVQHSRCKVDPQEAALLQLKHDQCDLHERGL
jgi:hypothetical protein